MLDFTKHEHQELVRVLYDLDSTYNSRLFPDQRMEATGSAIHRIKEKLRLHHFETVDEEIHFFKQVFPETLALHFYYQQRIEWDRLRENGSAECLYRFTDQIFFQAENFRSAQKDFYEYCRDGKTYLDSFYFLRVSPVNRKHSFAPGLIIDPQSPPLHCELLARLIAFTRLENEMHQRIGESNKHSASKPIQSKLKWTDKNIFLIELVYALKEQGSFNQGNASLKEIFATLQEVFDVELRNPARQFQDILSRKTGNTNFLDMLIRKLEKKIEDIENDHLN
jgi:RteC protein